MALDRTFEVGIGSERVDPRKEQEKAQANNEPLPEGVAAWIVQLNHPPTAAERELLRQGFQLSLTDFVPQLAFVERLPGRIVGELREHPLVRAVVAYGPRFKIDPIIREVQTANNEPTTQRFDAVLFDDADVPRVVESLASLGATDIVAADLRKDLGDHATVRFQLSLQQVDFVSEIEEIRWIEPVARFQDDRGPDMEPPTGIAATFADIWARGLHGEGQLIAILDNGPPDLRHCFFADATDNTPGPKHRKVESLRNRRGTRFGQHATFVAGCGAGDDLHASGAAPQRGGAWAARLVIGNRNDLELFSDGANPTSSTMLEELIAAAAAGATVHSNSFHAEPQGRHMPATYDLTSADIDAFTWRDEDQIVFGSSGNTGETQGPPGTAKNAVCVSAARRDLDPPALADGASGPTSDGRRKPDLMVVGCGIESAQLGGSTRENPCRTLEKPCASSFATPLAAAGAALIRQYFIEGFHPSGARRAEDARMPSGALLKAILVNATVLTAKGAPDQASGWGVVDLAAMLFFQGGRRRLVIEDVRNASGLTTGQATEHVVRVEGDDEPFRVTLVWTEPPAGVGAAVSVVNDLNLEVMSPDGVRFLGNVYESGHSSVGGQADRLNNVEMVSVGRPAKGDWKITIKAAEVNVGAPGQGFALVVSGRVAARRTA